MKKLLFMFLFCFSFCLISPAAYAGQKEVTAIEVTGGVDLEEERISTFDDSRQISGVANCGTDVNIIVYSVSKNGDLVERENYELKVGKSGIFSQSVEFSLGENLVEISAVEEGKDTFSDEITVMRKNSVIKRQLENRIYLPGCGI